MRPLSLELSGFRSYQRSTTISFEGRSFLAIVGPTGAGKSSLLDGISYALYGKTPRIRAGVKRLICSRSEAAHVRLRFEVDGRAYGVTRALPRKGAGEHILLDEVSGERWVGAEEVAAKVNDLLGLDFEAFGSSVLLAQGQFARFLQATPAERSKILKGVFRLEQIEELRKRARDRVVRMDVDLAEIAGELKGIPDDAEAQLNEARAGAKQAGLRVAELEAAAPEEKQLEESVRAATVDARQAAGLLETARVTRDKVPAPEGLELLGKEENEARARVAESGAKLALRVKAATAATESLTRLESEIGSEQVLIESRGRAEARVEAIVEIEGVERSASEARALVERLTEEEQRAHVIHREVKDLLQQRQRERLEVEQEHRAHLLRDDLRKGEPCPVCEQVVVRVPTADRPEELEGVEEAELEAERLLEEAGRAASKLQADLGSARTSCDHYDADIGKRGEQVAKLEERLDAVVGPVEDPLAEVRERLQRLVAAKATLTNEQRLQEHARLEEHQSKVALDELRTRVAGAAANLISIAAAVGLQGPAFEDSAESLSVQARDIAARLVTTVEDLEESLLKTRARIVEGRESLRALHRRLGLDQEATITTARADAAAEAHMLEAKARDLEGKLERAEELAGKRSGLERRRAVFQRLVEDLTDARFTSFLLEDRRALLAELGSERLRAMTGRYRFDDESGFDVVDELDGDKRREVETLSGGETFLASLALALALAEAIGRHGGRLQCFFLDEGFGSLDSESLDLALDGIERIVGPERLIALVSHVQALAARVEDRVELEKSSEGMTVVGSGASLG